MFGACLRRIINGHSALCADAGPPAIGIDSQTAKTAASLTISTEMRISAPISRNGEKLPLFESKEKAGVHAQHATVRPLYSLEQTFLGAVPMSARANTGHNCKDTKLAGVYGVQHQRQPSGWNVHHRPLYGFTTTEPGTGPGM